MARNSAPQPDPGTWEHRTATRIQMVLDLEYGIVGLDPDEHHADLVAMLLDERARLAKQIGIAPESAQALIGEKFIREYALEVAVERIREMPGANPLDDPISITLPLETIAHITWALQIAAHAALRVKDLNAADYALAIAELPLCALASDGAPVTLHDTIDGEEAHVTLPLAAVRRMTATLHQIATRLRNNPDVEFPVTIDPTEVFDQMIEDAHELDGLIDDMRADPRFDT